MTTAIDILNEFFSTTSKEKVWVMPESDEYTKIVRDWSPVQALEYGAVIDIYSGTKKIHYTNRMWKPTIQASRDADVGNWYGNKDIIYSPPGTEPDTCKLELARYFAEKAASRFTNSRITQRVELQRGVIGSFRFFSTSDKINLKEKTGVFNFWMFNSMSRKSLGDHAPIGTNAGMQTQYMWWNWTAAFDWKGQTRRITGWR